MINLGKKCCNRSRSPLTMPPPTHTHSHPHLPPHLHTQDLIALKTQNELGYHFVDQNQCGLGPMGESNPKMREAKITPTWKAQKASPPPQIDIIFHLIPLTPILTPLEKLHRPP